RNRKIARRPDACSRPFARAAPSPQSRPLPPARRSLGSRTMISSGSWRAMACARFPPGTLHRVPPATPSAVLMVRDESADLVELARTPMIVVCAGAKSVLDLPATMERLESLGVAVVGYRVGELPGFLTSGTGISLSWRMESAAEVAAAWRVQRSLGRMQAMLVVQPPPASCALPRALVDAAVEQALEAAARANVAGAALTPWLLGRLEQDTEGASLAANVALLESNAALAAEIAVEVATDVEIVRARA